MFKFLSVFCSLLLTVQGVSAQTFADVAPNHWAYSFIEDLVGQSIVDDGYFYHPDRFLARVELVKIMVIATTGVLDDRLPATPTFPDVKPDQWYYPYIETAHITGLINGYPDGYFRPGQKVIRAEAVKILVNALGIPKSYDPPVRFRDYGSSEWFHVYVASAFNSGVITGYTNDEGYKQMLFGPADFITRAEMAKITSKGISISTLY
ncbi:S-layer homology domain-containing protein [Candidatus Peregrinibacteria bacterium]|jgi:hypothetical protein|nr:S-layer homology domain-containing protein [Candidatus Peregrinibacteria bacterium]